jgi:CheY-like chemotaxis protein
MKPVAEVRVLVVEDDPFFQRVLQKRLAAEGYHVQAAGDGREGMKSIVAWEPDLVISDWMMPEVDGLELCQSVKTGLRDAAPYFILLTAKGELSDRLLGLETGADDYLVKPCDQAELMARVRAGLRIIGLTRELRDTVARLQPQAAAPPAAPAAAARPAAPTPQPIHIHELIAICSFCKKVRTGEEQWQEIDKYLAERAQAEFTHGICPGCRTEHYPAPQPRRASGE